MKLIDALENEALGAFKVARRLELTLRIDPTLLKSYGRDEIRERLRKRFASDHVDLAHVDTLVEQLDPLPKDWYYQAASLLDCAETLRTHVTVYEYHLKSFRRHTGGREPSVAYVYLAAEQQQFGKTDEQVARSLADLGFTGTSEPRIAQFRENVIKKHRLRWLERMRAERARQ